MPGLQGRPGTATRVVGPHRPAPRSYGITRGGRGEGPPFRRHGPSSRRSTSAFRRGLSRAVPRRRYSRARGAGTGTRARGGRR